MSARSAVAVLPRFEDEFLAFGGEAAAEDGGVGHLGFGLAGVAGVLLHLLGDADAAFHFLRPPGEDGGGGVFDGTELQPGGDASSAWLFTFALAGVGMSLGAIALAVLPAFAGGLAISWWLGAAAKADRPRMDGRPSE